MKQPNIPVVYVAGPYRAKFEYQRRANILNAADWACLIWRAGAAALCPHLNTAHFGGLVPNQMFLDGDLVMLHNCDALFLTPRWPMSDGARDERDYALAQGIPAFDEFEDLEQWIKDFDRDE